MHCNGEIRHCIYTTVSFLNMIYSGSYKSWIFCFSWLLCQIKVKFTFQGVFWNLRDKQIKIDVFGWQKMVFWNKPWLVRISKAKTKKYSILIRTTVLLKKMKCNLFLNPDFSPPQAWLPEQMLQWWSSPHEPGVQLECLASKPVHQNTAHTLPCHLGSSWKTITFKYLIFTCIIGNICLRTILHLKSFL